MRICVNTFDLTRLVFPMLQSRYLIIDYTKILLQFLSSKNRNALWILHKINVFLFQSLVNFNILTHFSNANFEKLLYSRCRVCPKENFLLITKANAKNCFIFIFLFFRPTDPSNFEKISAHWKLNLSGLNYNCTRQLWCCWNKWQLSHWYHQWGTVQCWLLYAIFVLFQTLMCWYQAISNGKQWDLGFHWKMVWDSGFDCSWKWDSPKLGMGCRISIWQETGVKDSYKKNRSWIRTPLTDPVL